MDVECSSARKKQLPFYICDRIGIAIPMAIQRYAYLCILFFIMICPKIAAFDPLIAPVWRMYNTAPLPG